MNWVDFGGGIFLVNHQFGVASVAIICPDHITVFKKIEAGTSTMLIFQRFFGGISFQGFPCLGSVRTLSGLCFGIGEMENHGKLWMRWNTIINTSGCFSIFWKMNDHVYVYRANLYIHIYRACSTVSLYIYSLYNIQHIYIHICVLIYIVVSCNHTQERWSSSIFDSGVYITVMDFHWSRICRAPFKGDTFAEEIQWIGWDTVYESPSKKKKQNLSTSNEFPRFLPSTVSHQ